MSKGSQKLPQGSTLPLTFHCRENDSPQRPASRVSFLSGSCVGGHKKGGALQILLALVLQLGRPDLRLPEYSENMLPSGYSGRAAASALSGFGSPGFSRLMPSLVACGRWRPETNSEPGEVAIVQLCSLWAAHFAKRWQPPASYLQATLRRWPSGLRWGWGQRLREG